MRRRFVRAGIGLHILMAEDNVYQPRPRHRPARKARPLSRACRQWTRGSAGRRARSLRPDPDGRPDAGDGRFSKPHSVFEESELGSGRHIPIAAMTAHAMAGDRERCLAAGMDDYISKPLQKAELVALLDRIIAKVTRARKKAHKTNFVTLSAAALHERAIAKKPWRRSREHKPAREMRERRG